MSTKKLQLYKCNICGNLVQVLLNGVGELVCCEKPMELLTPRKEKGNELAEKHTPKVEKQDGKFIIKLNEHPMKPEHYIQFIEGISKDKKEIYLKYFEPNQPAEFEIKTPEINLDAIEYCNIHGLWRNIDD